MTRKNPVSATEKEYWDGLEERAAAAVGMKDMGRIFGEVMADEPAPPNEPKKFAEARKRMRKSIDDLTARGVAPVPVND